MNSLSVKQKVLIVLYYKNHKFFKEGDEKRNTLTEFNSNNNGELHSIHYSEDC